MSTEIQLFCRSLDVRSQTVMQAEAHNKSASKGTYSKDKIIETKCLVLSDSCQNIDETECNEI